MRFRYQQEEYARLRFLANYYAWQARKGFALPGNDPITGRPKRGTQAREDGRAAHVALARLYLNRARAYRETH